MAVHSQHKPIQRPESQQNILAGRVGLSEKNLSRNVNALAAKVAKLKSRSGTPLQDSRSSSPLQNDVDGQRLIEAAKKREIERELADYMCEDLLDPRSDRGFHTILSYWKVSARCSVYCPTHLLIELWKSISTSLPNRVDSACHSSHIHAFQTSIFLQWPNRHCGT